MFLALSPRFRRHGLREHCISNFDVVKVIHYSGSMKPSSRFSESQYQELTDAEWLNIYMKSFKGYSAWIEKDLSVLRKMVARDRVYVDHAGRFREVQPPSHQRAPENYAFGNVVQIPEALLQGALECCRSSYEMWHNLYVEMTSELALHDLSHHVRLTCGILYIMVLLLLRNNMVDNMGIRDVQVDAHLGRCNRCSNFYI